MFACQAFNTHTCVCLRASCLCIKRWLNWPSHSTFNKTRHPGSVTGCTAIVFVSAQAVNVNSDYWWKHRIRKQVSPNKTCPSAAGGGFEGNKLHCNGKIFWGISIMWWCGKNHVSFSEDGGACEVRRREKSSYRLAHLIKSCLKVLTL